MTKELVITAMTSMPNEFHLDELFETLVFIEEVEKGRKDINEGRTITHSEMKKIIEGWRK